MLSRSMSRSSVRSSRAMNEEVKGQIEQERQVKQKEAAPGPGGHSPQSGKYLALGVCPGLVVWVTGKLQANSHTVIQL